MTRRAPEDEVGERGGRDAAPCGGRRTFLGKAATAAALAAPPAASLIVSAAAKPAHAKPAYRTTSATGGPPRR